MLVLAAATVFSIAPPPRPVIQTTTTERVLVRGSQVMLRRKVNVETRVSGVRSTGPAWKQETRSTSLQLNGRPVVDPLLQTLTRFPLIYRFGADGGLRAVDGLEKVVDESVALMRDPEHGFDAHAPAPERSALLERERDGWKARGGALIGQPTTVGTTVRWSESVSGAPRDDYPLVVVAKVTGTAPCAAASKLTCQVLSLAFEPGPQAPSRIRLSGTGEWRVDPHTSVTWMERRRIRLEQAGSTPDDTYVLLEERSVDTRDDVVEKRRRK